MSTCGEATFDAIVRRRARETPDQLALRFTHEGTAGETQYTAYDLDRRARGVAAALLDVAAPGDRALLLYEHARDFIAGFLGCLYAGVVAVPLYAPRRNRSLHRVGLVAANARATLALTTRNAIAKLDAELLRTAGVEHLYWLATDTLDDSLADGWPGPVSRAEDVAFLQYTSGSTGEPKGVMITHANLLHNSAAISEKFGHTENSRGVMWLPFYHDMGLIGGLLQPLFAGMSTTILPATSVVQRPLLWLRAISEFRANTSGGPNFIFDLCVEKIRDDECTGLDLSSWDLAVNGAEPIRPDTLDRFAARFGPYGFRREAFYPTYGMAETTLILTGGPKLRVPVVREFSTAELQSADDARPARLVSCGSVIPGHELRIVDSGTGLDCPPRTVGEIWTRGPSAARGYWQNPEATAATFAGAIADDSTGWLRTGDLGIIDEGELFIAGRLKDLIIIRGKNHFPQDLEATAAASHPALQSGSAVAFSSTVDGNERLVLVLELRREFRQQVPAAEVVTAIRGAILTEHQLEVATVVLLRPLGLPKTSSGKVQRRLCRAMFLDHSLDVIHQDTQMNQVHSVNIKSLNQAALRLLRDADRPRIIAAHLKHTIAEMLGSDPSLLDSDHSLKDLGLDSMSLMQLKLHIDNLIGADFDLDRFLTLPTIGQLARWCDETLVSDMGEPTAANTLDIQELLSIPTQCSASKVDTLPVTNVAQPTSSTAQSVAPGPADRTDLENLAIFNGDFFGHLLELTRQYGELVRFRWGQQLFHLVTNPDDLKEVFITDRETYIRGEVWSPFKALMGENGLITTEGLRWQQERRTARPMFSQQQLDAETDDIVEIVDEYIERLCHRSADERFSVIEDMKEITLRVILKKLFSAGHDDRSRQLMALLKPIDDLWNVPLRFIMSANPSAAQFADADQFRHHYSRIMAELDPLVFSYVDEHLAAAEPSDDLAGHYLRSELLQTMPPAAARQYLRDMAVTILLTGFDTTSAALFWTIHLLASHPAQQAELHRELGGLNLASLNPELLASATYLQAVIHESLRLYPPVWYVGREVTRPATLRGCEIPQGSFILASPYVVHRNPRVWSDATAFRPERFLNVTGSPFNLPGYLPFGMGARYCIGRPLAMHEIGIVIARLFDKFEVRLSRPAKPDLLTAFTLRPRQDVQFQIRPRASRSQDVETFTGLAGS